MPASVIVAIAASVVSEAVVVGLGLAIGSLGATIIGAAVGLGTSALLNAAFSDGSDAADGSPQFEQELRDNLVTVRQPISHWQTIYGRVRVGGALTFAHESADDNLHLVITYAGHVCQEIEAVQFNDEIVPLDSSGNATGRYAGYVRILKSLGDEAGQPFAALVAEAEGKWTDAHRQSGRTKLYVRLTPSADLFPTGIPNITCIIKGKKVYDPRTGSTVWTDNPSLCIADFLCDDVWLNATYADEIDETQLIAAANIDDEEVLLASDTTTFTADASSDALTLADGARLPYCGMGVRVSTTGALPTGLSAATTYYVSTAGGALKLATSLANARAGTIIDITGAGSGTHTLTYYSEPRYTLNGPFSVNTDARSVIGRMLSANAGRLHYIGGVFRILPAAYVSPTLTFDEDSLRGVPKIEPRLSASESCNGVKGVYVSEDNLWQPSDFPPVTNGTYLAEDGYERSWRELDLPFTKSAATAQRIAKIELERSRQQISVAWPGKLTCYRAQPGDVQQFTFAMLGWSAKEFEVVGGGLALDTDADGQPILGSDLALRETASSVFEWSSGEETVVDPAPDTNLPDPWTVAAPGAPTITEVLYETTGSAGVKAKAVATWTAGDAQVAFYELEYKLSSDSAYTRVSPISGLTQILFDLAPGTYNFRTRAVNGIGVHSSYSAVTTKELLGLTAAPSDISGFTVTKVGGIALAVWTLPTDLDVQINGTVVIRHANQTSGADWNAGVVLKEFPGGTVSGFLDLVTGTYLAKARDSSGNYSSTEASFVVTEGMVSGFTTVTTVTESTAFTGTKTNVANTGTAIQLDGTTLIDDMVTNIDDWAYIDSLGGISGTGSYAFASTLDLTTVATRRFESDIEALSFDTGDLIDDRLDNIDDWDEIDGGVINDCTVTLLARITDDDPAGTPTWSSWVPYRVSDFTCRAIQHKLDFASGNAQHNISVSVLKVDVKTPVSP